MRLLALATFVSCAWAQSIQVLSQEQIQQLEITVAQHPEDRQFQKLLGQSYALFILGVTMLGDHDMVTGVDAVQARSDFAQHARDAINTSSLATVVGEGGQALWNFAGLPGLHGVRDRADFLEGRRLGVLAIDRAVSLDPENGTWRAYRIPILVNRSDFAALMPLTATEAYIQVKQDIALLPGTRRSSLLPSAAKLAVKANALDDAEADARELLNSANNPKDWNYGNAIFFGNMVLGQVALRRGDAKKAASFLLAAGKTSGSPQLNSFGPNMSLANDLLAAGERQSVLDFFDLCSSFWKMDSGRLQKWHKDVAAGVDPQFGANLLY